MDTWIATYSERLFWLFPIATSLISMAAFLLFALPLTWIAYRDSPRWRRYRIQNKHREATEIIGPSIKSWLTNNLVMTALVVAAWPLLRLAPVHAGPLPPSYVIALQVVGLIYLDDFLFYWMHRLLHHKRLYKHVHVVHHRIPAPWAISAHYMHPVEFVATGTLALVGPVLIGAHVATIWIWIAFRQWEAAEGHSGYSFPWNPSHLFPGYGGTEYHDFHHAKFVGNYAGFLGYLDRFFGTYAKGYREAVAAKRKERSRHA